MTKPTNAQLLALAKPMMFQDYNIKPIMAGQKDVTRRVLTPNIFKLDKDGNYMHNGNPHYLLHLIAQDKVAIREQNGRWFVTHGWNTVAYFDCPYGDVGSLLWVREAFVKYGDEITYKADYPHLEIDWSSPLFLHRKDARLYLRITSIRLERVTEITEDQAKREGCIPFFTADISTFMHGSTGQLLKNASYVESYRRMWQEINGKPKPVRNRGTLVRYISNAWSNKELYEQSPDLFFGDPPQLVDLPFYKDLPIVINTNPYVWVVEFEIFGGTNQ